MGPSIQSYVTKETIHADRFETSIVNAPYGVSPASCGVCGSTHNIVGCVASQLGPVSDLICRTCLTERAESEGMFDYIASECGSDVREDIFELKTFKDGKYITYRKYLKTWQSE